MDADSSILDLKADFWDHIESSIKKVKQQINKNALGVKSEADEVL